MIIHCCLLIFNISVLLKFFINIILSMSIKIIIIVKVNKVIFIRNEELSFIFSFEDSDDIYINKINIPPMKIKNKIYENQKFLVSSPDFIQVKIVWMSKIIPIDNGCVIWVKRIVLIIKVIIIKFCMMQKIVYKKY